MVTREPGQPAGSPERPARFFADAAEWRAWLEVHHADRTEIWMELRKKHVPDRGLVWAAAVREALCFGWIDSQVQRIDADAVRQRWTPRRRGSIWSAVNVRSVGELTEAGLMHPAGIAVFEARKPEHASGYTHEQGELVLPPAYEKLLHDDEKAWQFWQLATMKYRRVAINWVTSAKTQATNDKRMAALVEDCAARRLIKSQRYGDEPAWVRKARAQLG